MDHFFCDSTIVTDDAAVMARVANASVSTEIHAPNETWMSCTAHGLNNIMKSVMFVNCNGATLEVAVQDFWAMKKIIEDGNRSGWNHLLPYGYKLLQEYGTRFRTYYKVSERFLKAAHFIDNMVDSNLGNNARAAYISLKKHLTLTGPLEVIQVSKLCSMLLE